MSKNGNLYIISAPSGAGKTSLLKALMDKISNFSAAVSTTTREIRSGEVDGVDYHFVSIEKFLTMVQAGAFLEHAEVFGNFYGTSENSVTKALEEGQDLVLEIDWQGAQQVRKQIPEAISIFIFPPSRDTLAERLKGRAQDDATVIEKRMAAAIEEMSHYNEFDYLVINDVFGEALKDLENIIKSYRLTLSRQSTNHRQLITNLL
ncbi:MAG: guanylate kinase [Gammaproteobacteria bacterium]|nr:guanylate kinase [Gammaproteobacteria bacterium]